MRMGQLKMSPVYCTHSGPLRRIKMARTRCFGVCLETSGIKAPLTKQRLFAIPFLIELAQDRQTRDRVGVLQLPAAIANRTSYRAKHGDILKESDFREKKERELDWAYRAQAAVDSGFAALLALAREDGDLGLAAAHVLAQLPQRAEAVSTLLFGSTQQWVDSLQRAGLLLLLGNRPLLASDLNTS